MEALVEYGANIDCIVTEAKITPLIMVASVGHLELVTWLLNKGADPNVACPLNGSTAIMLASKYGHPRCIAEIMRKKGAISAKDVRSYPLLPFDCLVDRLLAILHSTMPPNLGKREQQNFCFALEPLDIKETK
jgi:ankyrin repeat protein